MVKNTCNGLTKEGNRCLNQVTDGNYCWLHKGKQVGGDPRIPRRRGFNGRLGRPGRPWRPGFSGFPGLPGMSDDAFEKTLTCSCDCEGNIGEDELMAAMQEAGLIPSSSSSLSSSSFMSSTSSEGSKNFNKYKIKNLSTNPNLSFNGKCEEAFKYYEKVFGGKIIAMTPWSRLSQDELESVPKTQLNKIAHASIKIGDSVIYGDDTLPGQYVKPAGFSVTVNLDDPGKADRIFKTLAKDGRVTMDMMRTSWADRFGLVTDKYDIPWMINSMQLT